MFIGAAGMGALATRAIPPTCSSTRTARWANWRRSARRREESNKKVDAAGKAGDPNAQAAAAIEGLGALLGGGKRVDPVSIELLKPLVPETFVGLAKKSYSAEKTGFASLMVSKAEARYSDDAGSR